jgi:hypothetical protein
MQITFTGTDGKQITVGDPRRPALAAATNLPEPKRPTSWIMGAWITSTMKV